MLSSFLFHPGFQPEKGYYVATRRETGGKFVFQRTGASYFRIFSKNLAKKADGIANIYRLFNNTFQRPSPSDISSIFYSLVNSRRLLMIEIV